jgi:predicted O-linked N-acetylglucosamine transferase (SPINDLY family)
MDAFQHAVKIKPDYARGWTGLGSSLHLAGRAAEAIACHTRALELDPCQPVARFARAQSFQACHCIDESLADFDEHLKLRPEHHEARSFRLFVLNYRDDLSREALFAEHLAYGRAVESATEHAVPSRWQNQPDPERRLRIAFLSPDLRTHSVAFFIEPILAHLDRSQFEVFLYHDFFTVDSVSARLRKNAAVWRHIAGLKPEAAEKTIRADTPDILIDLAGHTGFNRMGLFAGRLAPIQAAYLGYPNTTGLRAMDYRFTDPVADPPGDSDLLHTEKLVRFASTAWAYAPPPGAPEPVPGRRDGPVTFGSFNALAKLNVSTLRLWREILESVPGSQLILKSASEVLPGWSRRLAETGLPVDRVRLRKPAASIEEHLAGYSQIDVALDPFPYNGTTTTCEALWMGVPVVTLAGDRHAARVGASLLTAIQRPEWIASSRAEYVRIAASLAADRGRIDALRTQLRGDMCRSALLDHPGQARHFGAALRDLWRVWCAKSAIAA